MGYELPINEQCYRCRYQCPACGPRLALFYDNGQSKDEPVLHCPYCSRESPIPAPYLLDSFGEAEWSAGGDCEAMVHWADDHFREDSVELVAPQRKLRLFACRCCYCLWPALAHPDSRAAVQVAERFADGVASEKELNRAFWKANAVAWAAGERKPAWVANFAALDDLFYARFAVSCLLVCVKPAKVPLVKQHIAAWLLDIFGIPFRPVAVDPAWRTATVVALAEAIYAERAFDRLPILADALEEAGCTSADLLNHCRQPGEHVRGCWAVDLVLGKG